ncbi:Eco57I restriction-modification methylase domain-containing protein [Methanobrevibacter sp.]|uniref:Eco57I restriction-modification methylase domain-containing protein n=1 Tax=Methanobrevibacter sp. TaxID=66852 RepID=UPI003890DA87
MVNAVLNQEDIDAGREKIAELVAKFNNNKKFYISKEFKEEEAKIEFINPMFEALGWDIHNKQGHGPNFKEVIFEESLSIGKETKAPDYSFRLGGQLIYYLEAKKPSVNIKDDRSPAFQARRYGWSAKIPIVILTDFEELAVYETSSKPKEHERASTNRVLYYNCDEYIDKWEEIYSLFSKEAVQKELFQKFVDDNTSKTKKGTQSIDIEFLKDIEKWRLILARNIALRNKDLTLSELNLAVQLIIDRIVFFRMAEDRGIERYQTLYKLAESENIYKQLCEVFRKADLKYNSGLFHFNFTPDYSEFVDNITLQLNIDDGVFKEIFADLYYPKSPYEFSVISPEILGDIYENFLGSIIRLTPSHQAKIEQKPEVKKAGGVFYTPQYIVDYIVENTVGELIKGKTPNQIAKLRILDPACGSGSFLLRAYQKLLDYHLEYYIGLKQPPKEVYYIGKDNVPRLTIREKKRILTNNIYGVDIDVNAVEVTKLSLLLKVLEDENKDVLEQQQKLYQEKVLPNLSYNIKCGNSLIGIDILDQEDLEHDEILKLNPFNWEHEFPLVFANDGFDAVIGNPPYIRTQTMDKTSIKYYKNNYLSSSKGNYDIYIIFVEKALQLLNEKGISGYILPHKFFTAKYGMPLRKMISENKNLKKIIHFGVEQVFDSATTYTCLLFLSKYGNKKFYFEKINNLNKIKTKYLEDKHNLLSSDLVSSDEWVFVAGKEGDLFYKLYNMPLKLVDKTIISQGLATSADKIYILPLIENNGDTAKVESKFLDKTLCVENDILRPLLKGAEIKRYEEPKVNNLLIFPYSVENDELVPFSRNDIKKYPLAFDYLSLTKDKLLKRSNVDSKNWWLYPYPKNLLIMNKPKIIYQVLSQRGSFTLDNDGEFYYVGGGNAGGYAITTQSNNIDDLKYLLGILNSKLTTFFISKVASAFKGGYYSFGKHSFEKFPLPSEDLIDSSLVELVDNMINLNKKLNLVKTPQEEKLLKIQLDNLDHQINNKVYELYGLTSDEIKIIEDSIND